MAARRLVALTAAFLVPMACGGSPEPKTPNHRGTFENEDADTPHSSAEESLEEPPDPVATQCADGSCSACGDALCPTGYYCDESETPPVCSWLPECARALSCTCIDHVLGEACRCEMRDGGIYVTCT